MVRIVSLRIQSECRKMGTRITPNKDTFHAVGNVEARTQKPLIPSGKDNG